MTTVIVILPILFLLVLGIPILIGVYVYRDASKRGMNALLWALVAIFAPSLIGLIIYLLVRGNYSDMTCPKCATPVTEQYVVCPKCGVKLKPSCPNCSAPVEQDWKLCPRCATTLPEQYEDIEPPHRVKDKSLGKILIVLIVVPILLLAILFGGMIAMRTYTGNGGGSSTMFETSFDELYSVQETSYVREWLESCDDDGSAYALEYAITFNGVKHYYYLLYVPSAGSGASTGLGMYHGVFRSDICKVEFQSGEPNKNVVYCVALTADKVQSLEIYLNGNKLDCEITEVAFNPIENLVYDITGNGDFWMDDEKLIDKYEN